MKERITAKKFTANVLISITVQIVSLAVGFILQLIVPKFIPQLQYAYWKTFILYAGYVGVLHFGLLDGLVLRYSQYDYEELDKERIRSQFKTLLITVSALTLLIVLVSLLFLEGVTKEVFVFVAISVTTKNIFTYNSYTFQITNRIQKYALLVLAQKLFYGIGVILLLIFGVQGYYWFCLAEIGGEVFSCALAALFNKGMYFGKSLPFLQSLKETKCNIAAGIVLMLANWSSMLIVGGAQMVIQWRFDKLVFGKLSFAFTLTNLFLTFILAVSVVMFPSLKRSDPDKLSQIYQNVRKVLLPLLLLVLVCYFPGCWVLRKWLPDYVDSLPYVGLLLPIILYSSRESLLTNNYLKVYRKERQMMIINFLFAVVGMTSFLLCAYVFTNLTALLVCLLLSIILRAIALEIVVLRAIGVRIVRDYIAEALVAAGFIVVVKLLPLGTACLAYLGILAVYFIVHYKTFLTFFKQIKRRGEE